MSTEVKSAILDSEAVAWDRETKTIKPFQVSSLFSDKGREIFVENSRFKSRFKIA